VLDLLSILKIVAMSPGGSTWGISGIRKLLKNEAYLGKRVWNKVRRYKRGRKGGQEKPRKEWVVTENAHPAIIDEDLWAAVQERRGQIRVHIENGGGRKAVHSPHMLAGLLKCGECGGNFTVTGVRTRSRYYRCSNHANRGTSVCTNKRLIRQDRIEVAVLKAASEQLLTVEVIESIMEEYRLAASDAQDPVESQDLDKAIRQVGKEIANLTASLKALGPTEELVEEMKACQARKVTLEKEQREKKALTPADLGDIDIEEVKAAIASLSEVLEDATPEEKKALMRDNVTEIQIDKEREPLLISNPEGLLTSLGMFLSSHHADP